MPLPALRAHGAPPILVSTTGGTCAVGRSAGERAGGWAAAGRGRRPGHRLRGPGRGPRAPHGRVALGEPGPHAGPGGCGRDAGGGARGARGPGPRKLRAGRRHRPRECHARPGAACRTRSGTRRTATRPHAGRVRRRRPHEVCGRAGWTTPLGRGGCAPARAEARPHWRPARRFRSHVYGRGRRPTRVRGLTAPPAPEHGPRAGARPHQPEDAPGTVACRARGQVRAGRNGRGSGHGPRRAHGPGAGRARPGCYRPGLR